VKTEATHNLLSLIILPGYLSNPFLRVGAGGNENKVNRLSMQSVLASNSDSVLGKIQGTKAVRLAHLVIFLFRMFKVGVVIASEAKQGSWRRVIESDAKQGSWSRHCERSEAI
jgi:hypothetical protein